MRRYDEPVQVRIEQARDVDDVDAAPVGFLWHGRVYVVQSVVERWVRRLPWWRRALAADGGTWALHPDLLDEHVWRVVAAARGAHSTGTYDLSRGAADSWRLLRIGD